MVADTIDKVIDKIAETDRPIAAHDRVIGAAGIGIGWYGEQLQNAVMAGEMDYNWWVGHLGDLTGPVGIGLLALPFVAKNFTRYQAVGFVAGFYTFTEITGFMEASPTDPQDVACYWGWCSIGSEYQ
tara:strand:- start:2240 stop:2620 length:381 start_codon:yes stop_codon:yes gene_type:complete